MRWLVEKPCLAIGDRIIQKGDLVPEGALETEVIHRFVARGYLDLEIPAKPKPEPKPEPKLEPKPEPKLEPKPEPKKLDSEIEKAEPLPTKKRTRKKPVKK